MSRFYQSKINGIVIDDTSYGTDHAWSPDRIVSEINNHIGNIDLSLSSLKDVNLTNLSNGYTLVYNSSTSKWEAKQLATSLRQLTDVDLTNLANKYILQYDSSSNKFKSTPLSLSFNDITDFDGSSKANGYVIKFDSSLNKYKVSPISFSDLTDFDSSNKANGYIIRYDSSSGKYKTTPLPKLVELSDVNPTGLTEKSVLQYSTLENKFKTVPMFKLEDLSNVNISSFKDGQVLIWSQSRNAFILTDLNVKTRLRDLLDVDVSSIEDGDILKYDINSDKYVSSPLSLSQLSDVDLTNLQNGFVLQYDANIGKFVPKMATIGGGTGGDGNVIFQNLYNTYYNGTIQVTKLGVIADPSNPKEVDINIPFTNDFNLGKIEVLKYIEGNVQTENIAHFDNSDESDFEYDEEMVSFDGKMHLNTETTFVQNEYTEDGNGGRTFILPINKDKWKRIDNITIN